VVFFYSYKSRNQNRKVVMTNTTQALALALEALENSVDLVVEDAYNAEQLYGKYPTRQGKVGGLKVLADQHKEAINAIREALAQPAAQAEPNEADQLLTALRLDPDTYRTDGGWLNIPKIMAAIASPADYPYTTGRENDKPRN
jgi:hypothetical protein